MRLGIWGLAAVVCAMASGQGRWDRPSVEQSGQGDIRPHSRPHSWMHGNRGGGAPKGSTTPEFLFPSDIATAYGIHPQHGRRIRRDRGDRRRL